MNVLFGIPASLWVGRSVLSCGSGGSKRRAAKNKVSAHCRARITRLEGEYVVIIPNGHGQEVKTTPRLIKPNWQSNPDLRDLKKYFDRVKEVNPLHHSDLLYQINRQIEEGRPFTEIHERLGINPNAINHSVISAVSKPAPVTTAGEWWESDQALPVEREAAPEPAPISEPDESPAPTESKPEPTTAVSAPQTILLPSPRVSLSLELTDDGLEALRIYKDSVATVARIKVAYERAIAEQDSAKEMARQHGITFLDDPAPSVAPTVRKGQARTGLKSAMLRGLAKCTGHFSAKDVATNTPEFDRHKVAQCFTSHMATDEGKAQCVKISKGLYAHRAIIK